jgi:hypothetical protein
MNWPEQLYTEIPSAHEQNHEDEAAKQEAYGTLDNEIGNELATLQLDLEQPSNHLEDVDGVYGMELLSPHEHPPVRVS